MGMVAIAVALCLSMALALGQGVFFMVDFIAVAAAPQAEKSVGL